MAILQWIRRYNARRKFLDRDLIPTAEQLAKSPLAAAAPEIAEAIGSLRHAVTASAYDAVTAAHASFAPLCETLVRDVRRDFDRRHADQAEDIRALAIRCRDEVERAHSHEREQLDELRALRELFAAHLPSCENDGLREDKAAKKELCSRFIGILDGLEDRLVELRANGNTTDVHIRDIETTYRNTLQALEAVGLRQARPRTDAPIAGQDTIIAVANVPTDSIRHDGLIARVRRPGYVLLRDGGVERVLRPAEVEVFAAHGRRPAPNLQNS